MMMNYIFTTPKKLKNLKFSVWNTLRQDGHSLFVGNLVETWRFLETSSIQNLQVSALDLPSMCSLVPASAEEWLDWYYQIALSALEENDYDSSVWVPYLSDSWTEFELRKN